MINSHTYNKRCLCEKLCDLCVILSFYEKDYTQSAQSKKRKVRNDEGAMIYFIK